MNIIFVCHGNICRSPVAGILFSNLVKENGLENKISVLSRATSFEEIGNDIYPPMKKVLNMHKIPYENHCATRITTQEFNNADYIFYMDSNNLYYLRRMFGKSSKFHLISEYYNNEEIEDPWYTDRFEFVYEEIKKSIDKIFEYISKLL